MFAREGNVSNDEAGEDEEYGHGNIAQHVLLLAETGVKFG
jgi:hypothetical protein